MDEQDKKSGKKKMPGSPILAPKGNVKGIGKMGQYTGGLNPLVVKPQPGLGVRRTAPVIMRFPPSNPMPTSGDGRGRK